MAKMRLILILCLLSLPLISPLYAQVSCDEVNSGSHDFYVDGQSLCGVCSDTNPGTVTQPWCSFERAFDFKQKTHLRGGGKLFIRAGLYRFNSEKFTLSWDGIYQDGISGTPGDYTEIGGYPGEVPVFYLSEKISDWQPYSTRPGIWQFNWHTYVKNKYPLLYDSLSFKNFAYLNPQIVAVDELNGPLFLQQVAARINEPAVDQNRPLASGEMSKIYNVGTNVSDMEAGQFYYENDKSKADFGTLYVWLPGGVDPQTKNIEVSLHQMMYFGHQQYVHVHDMAVRYSNGIGMAIGDSEGGDGQNKVSRVNCSYNAHQGLGGESKNSVVVQSTFTYNGWGGSAFRGNGTRYEGNIFIGNNWRRFFKGWHCGEKFIPYYKDMTFKNNSYSKTVDCPDLWLDYMNEGNVVEGNTFEGGFGLMIEVSSGTDEKPIVIKNNIFKNGDASQFWGGGVYIAVSQHVHVFNNLFYNTPSGVMVNGLESGPTPPGSRRRDIITYNRIYNNIFYKVSFPIAIPIDDDQTEIIDNRSDYNIFYGTGPTVLWDLHNIPVNSELRKTIYFCRMFCSGDDLTDHDRQTIDGWRQRGFDTHSQFMIDPLFKSLDSNDFHLGKESPAINAGMSLASVDQDINGVPRPQGASWDMGPYEYSEYSVFPDNLDPSTTRNDDAELAIPQKIFKLDSGHLDFFYKIKKPGLTTITVRDRHGEKIATLFDDYRDVGDNYSAAWNGRNASNQVVASGIYLVVLVHEGKALKEKIVVIK